MKLKTKIAGSLALPLALAVAANSAQAFTVVDNADQKVTIGGYVSAITTWNKSGNKTSADNDKFNNSFHAGNSRLNLSYTDKETGTKFFYEQKLAGTLRHMYFETEDGLIGGQTWSFGTNLVALAETIDTDGNSLVSYQVGGPRNLLLGKKFKLDEGMSIGLSLEDQNNKSRDYTYYDEVLDDDLTVEVDGANKSVIPAVTANFEGNFGDTKVFAAWTNYAVNVENVSNDKNTKGKDKRANRLTFGTDIGLGDANVKLGLTQNFGLKYEGDQVLRTADTAKGTHVSAALGFKVNDKVRTNLATEYSKWNKKSITKADSDKAGKAYRVWLNAFYQADNGIEWGAEYQLANIKAAEVAYAAAETHEGGLGNKGHAIRLQAKYAFKFRLHTSKKPSFRAGFFVPVMLRI